MDGREVDAISGFMDSAAAKPKDKLETAKNIGFSTRVLSLGLRNQIISVSFPLLQHSTGVLWEVLAWKS